MYPRGDSRTTRRLSHLTTIVFVWMAAILARLVYLQVYCHADLLAAAEQQHEKQIEVQAPRGTIYDRDGVELAMSLPVDSVCVNPLRIPNLELAADLLAKVLDLDAAALLDRMKSAVANRRGFLWVKRKIHPEESDKLRSFGLDWIEFRTESRRFYPHGELAAHVVGTVDHEERGSSGVELSMEDELQGRPGIIRLTTDVKQRGFDSRVFEEPQPGKNLYLSLNSQIQFVAERELAKAVQENHCRTGTVIVMIPATGEILAMANYPTFDPNVAPRPDEDTSARSNLCVMTPFEPGSVFKVITLTSALETTNLHPGTILNCGGGAMTLFGRVIHDAHPYSALSMADVLAKSSNIGAIQIGLRVGEERLYDYVTRFGFGRPTGICLPGESGGMVRKLKDWQKTSIGSVAMGHEISTTALQLSLACSAVANGGELVKPKLVLHRQRPGGRPEYLSTEPPRRIMKAETANTMRQLMEGVVLRGTGKAAKLTGYTSAGKTGSAQIFDFSTHQYTHKYNASFMGFAPVNRPAVVVVVTLNGASKFGGAVAAPVFHEVATAALRILDVPKDLLFEPPSQDGGDVPADDLAIADLSSSEPALVRTAASDQRGSLVEAAGPGNTVELAGPKVPDFSGKTLRTVLQESSALGLPVEISGQGIARRQVPPAGSILPPGERIRVQFVR
jgi:cell division protein FtsI (penicillin-binding protein 3)